MSKDVRKRVPDKKVVLYAVLIQKWSKISNYRILNTLYSYYCMLE